MINNLRFELSFKDIFQLENKLNFCKSNKIRILISLKGETERNYIILLLNLYQITFRI